jgi:hypothetical protein
MLRAPGGQGLRGQGMSVALLLLGIVFYMAMLVQRDGHA